MLKFNGVSKIYDDGTKATDKLSLSIERGEFCAMIGPSGSGKSTLMGMINGLVTPSEGELYFDDELITDRNMKRLRQRTRMIHQQLHLVPRLSVLHNVASGKLHELSNFRTLFKLFPVVDQRRACMLLQHVGLEEKHIYRRASELSGGQQQRVAIARAFMSAPEVVLADEPVSSLDPVVSRSVLQGLKNASRHEGATVLCSLHQVEFAAEFADRVIALRRGRLVFDGPPAELTDSVLNDIYQDEHIPRLEDQPHTAGRVAGLAVRNAVA
ncbi:MAG: phosphonate ABC transporter ATP-binding protein [Pseudomonadota bacterium]|nr:phosphonate ABC transporter ATP-binding protein [Pseudomonadota bacterium]